jgi:hypothetical protein
MLENDLVTWISSVLTDCEVFYQHLNRNPGSPFAWFIRSGDSTADSLNDDGEPDQVFFDLEIYSNDLTELQTLAATIRDQRDYRGDIGNGYVDDVSIADQVDGYELQASAESLPEYSTAFRVIVTGYES